MWAKQGVLLAWSTGGGGKSLPVISDSRSGRGPLPLGVPEQKPPAVPITSEEGIAIEHTLLLFSLLWELTYPAAAVAKAKCSGY